MADLTITAASVLAASGARKALEVAGAAITAGQAVYLDSTDNTVKLADSNSATAAARVPFGIALNGAAAGQPVEVQTSGPVTLGATLTPGSTYYLSATPGGICPAADLVTGMYPTILGIATSASVLDVAIEQSGVAL